MFKVGAMEEDTHPGRGARNIPVSQVINLVFVFALVFAFINPVSQVIPRSCIILQQYCIT